jgi:hypothetical protein
MVLGTLLWIIVIIIVIIVIVALLKFLFQLFFVVPLTADFSNDMLYANNVVAAIDISEI